MKKKIILINIIVIILLVITLEVFAKFFKISNLMGIEKGLIKVSNDIHVMVPESSGIHFGQKIYIDKNGFRVPYENYNYKGNDIIYIIGDSTSFGNGVIEEKTFVGKVRENFINWDILNSSVPGYNANEHLKNIQKIDKYKKIKKIFYFLTLNDIYETSNIIDLTNEQNLKRENKFKTENMLSDFLLIKKINAYLRGNSHLYMYLKGIVYDPSEKYFQNLIDYYKNNNIKILRKYLINLREKSSNMGLDLKIVILPYEYQTRSCENDILFPQKKVSETLQDLSIDYYDLTMNFCNYKNPGILFYKFDPMHLSEKGHKFVYELIKDEIN